MTAPLPPTLLLKVNQSVAVKLPVLVMEELGMLMVKLPPDKVAVNREPLVLVATVMAVCLLLKVVQSVGVKQPIVEAEELGQFKVKVLPAKDREGAWPEVPVAKVTDWIFLPASEANKVEADKVARLKLP